ncbi:hypothetical protein McanCB21832_005522 [Microsporum canis]
MKESDRVGLSSRIKELQQQMDSDILQRLVKDFDPKASSCTPPTTAATPREVSPPQHRESSLTGDVYRLTAQDVQRVIESGQIPGEIWLTITYYPNASPFVTIPISRKLSHHFATQRPQMM